MVICFNYEISPNMIGIQDGYNKNFQIIISYALFRLLVDVDLSGTNFLHPKNYELLDP